MKDTFVANVPKVNLDEFGNVIGALYKKGLETGTFVNVFAYGLPGLGKTATVKSRCKELGISYLNIRLGQISPMDFGGNPINVTLEDGEVRQSYSTPSCMPSPSIHGKKGILLLDEFNMASPTVMGMAQQLLDSRRIGSFVLPEGWMIVTCNNLRGHGAHVNEISMPNKSRAIHFNVLADYDSWLSYAINHIDPLIISYLNEFPQHFYTIPSSPTEAAYACPRTWEFASQLLSAGLENHLSAAIGEAVATNFNTYYLMRDQLPDWKKVETDPDYTWDGKANLSATYAATVTAVARATVDNFQTYLTFIATNTSEEYVAIFSSLAFRAHYKQTNNKRKLLQVVVNAKLPDGRTLSDLKQEQVRMNSEINQLMQ